MFSRFVTLLPLAALAGLVVAAPGPRWAGNACNKGNVRCCDSKFDTPTTFQQGGAIGSLLDVVVGVVADVSVQCSPVNVVGLLSNGADCTQQTACCEDNTVNGLINIVCSPININL